MISGVVNIVSATPDEISRWHSDFLQNCNDAHQAFQVISSLGGERLYSIRDGGGFFAKEGAEIIGVVSYSPTGEYNKPNIIGLWVKDHNIRVANEIIRHAIDALNVKERIIVDVIFQDEQDAYTESGLGKDYYDKLDLRYHMKTRVLEVVKKQTVLRVLSEDDVFYVVYDEGSKTINTFSDERCLCPAGLWRWQEKEINTAVKEYMDAV